MSLSLSLSIYIYIYTKILENDWRRQKKSIAINEKGGMGWLN